MCERYSFALPKEKISRRFGVKVAQPVAANYNLAPGDNLFIIRNDNPRLLTSAQWGMPGEKRFGKIQSVWRIPLEHAVGKAPEQLELFPRRCVFPADGFYLWRRVSKKSKVPYRVVLKWNLPFAMAGVWAPTQDENGVIKVTCALLTTAANGLLAAYAPTMPVILTMEAEKKWLADPLDPAFIREVASPYPADGMKIFPVTPQINQTGFNSSVLTEPFQPTDQFGNYVLFGE